MTDTKKPRVIVVGVDYSETSNLALDRAFELAAEIPTEVHALHVVPLNLPALAGDASSGAAVPLPSVAEAATRLKDHVESRSAAFVKTQRPARTPARVVTHLRLDAPSHEVAQLATDLEADLIIVGTHGRRGLSRMFLGSVAESTVRLAPCPVLVMRKKEVPAPVPAIAPPCPRCVEARKASGGTELWCEQHRERHGQRHTYHQSDRVGADTNLPLVVR